jgi:hypothetical protein
LHTGRIQEVLSMRSARFGLIVAAVGAAVIGWALASHGAAATPPGGDADIEQLAQVPPQGDKDFDPPWDRGGWGEPRQQRFEGRMPGQMRPWLMAEPRARMMRERLGRMGDRMEIVTNPMHATLAAVHGIVEQSKDAPKQAVSSLEKLLDQTDVLPVRTAVHFGLSRVLAKSGDHEGAIKQLQAVIAENAKAVGPAPRGGRPGPGLGEPREPRGPRERPLEPPPPPGE